MIEARMDKIAIMPEQAQTILYGVVSYGSDMMNIRVPFKFDEMNHKEFLEELRDTIAKEYDIPVYHVVLDDNVILGKMMMWTERFREMHLI
jgi:hypothetical protein